MRGSSSSVSRNKRRRLVLYNLYSTVEMMTTVDGPAVIDAKARYWSKIAIVAPVRGAGTRRSIVIGFGAEKLE